MSPLAGKSESDVNALLERLRPARHLFYADRWGAGTGLAALKVTSGAELAAEVAAHPPFGRLQLTLEQPIRTGLALSAVPQPVPICWTRTDLDLEASWGAKALGRAGVRPRSRVSDCLEGGLVSPNTLAISDALDHLDALALPVGPITTDAALDRAREVWAIVQPDFLIVDAPTFGFLDGSPRRPDAVLIVLLTAADAGLLRQPPRPDVYRILSLPQACTFAAGECRVHDGFHVEGEALVSEIGPAGTLLLSTLKRSATLLRFDSGLAATERGGMCSCGEAGVRVAF